MDWVTKREITWRMSFYVISKLFIRSTDMWQKGKQTPLKSIASHRIYSGRVQVKWARHHCLELCSIRRAILNKHPGEQRGWIVSLTYPVSTNQSPPALSHRECITLHETEECYAHRGASVSPRSKNEVKANNPWHDFSKIWDPCFQALGWISLCSSQTRLYSLKKINVNDYAFVPAQAHGHGKAQGNCYLANWSFGQEV